MKSALAKAIREGRICKQCGWMIIKKNWEKGYRLCGNCWFVNRGVSVSSGWKQPRQELREMTGEM